MKGPTPGMKEAIFPRGPLRILLAKPTAFFAKLPMLLNALPIFLMKAIWGLRGNGFGKRVKL
jgi:hypothetical protein